jgi:nucleotide-binding universal stress UspA family protein
MIRIRKILFPTDFYPCANQALDQALFLAGKYGAELHMFHAIVLHKDDPHNPAHHFPDLDQVYDRLLELARTEMEAAVESHKTSGIEIKQIQTRGIAAADAVLDYAEENDVDLIVMGTHGRRGLGHLFLGSVAQEVVRFARCPVLTIREAEKPRLIQDRKRILVPIDFSEHSRTAVRYGHEIATVYGGRLQLLHVIEEAVHPLFRRTGKTSIFDLNPDIREWCETAVEEMITDVAGSEANYETHVIPGYATRDIVKFADENETDMIVIATHGLTGLSHLVLGSVAEKVIRRASCLVLTIKSFGKSILVD